MPLVSLPGQPLGRDAGAFGPSRGLQNLEQVPAHGLLDFPFVPADSLRIATYVNITSLPEIVHESSLPDHQLIKAFFLYPVKSPCGAGD